jgi:hypothetical protein
MIKAFLFKNWKGLVILLVAALLIIWNVHLFNQGAINKKKAEVAEHNLQAANDTIRIVKDRAGRDEANKLAYLTNTVENLAKLNQELANEVKQIKGKVGTIIQSEVKVIHDTVPFIVQGQLIDSNVYARFKFDTTYSPGNFRKLSGYTKYDLKSGLASGVKETDELGVKFTTGIKNLDKGKPEIFLKSDYPGFQVSSLDGAVLDPKLFQPKRKTPLITPNLVIAWTPISFSRDGTTIDPGEFSTGIGLGFNLLKLLGFKK